MGKGKGRRRRTSSLDLSEAANPPGPSNGVSSLLVARAGSLGSNGVREEESPSPIGFQSTNRQRQNTSVVRTDEPSRPMTTISELTRQQFNDGAGLINRMTGLLNHLAENPYFIDNVQGVHARYMEQDEKIANLEGQLRAVDILKEGVIDRLLLENQKYRLESEQFAQDKADLDQEQGQFKARFEARETQIRQDYQAKFLVESDKIRSSLQQEFDERQKNADSNAEQERSRYQVEADQLKAEIEQLNSAKVQAERQTKEIEERLERVEMSLGLHQRRVKELEGQLNKVTWRGLVICQDTNFYVQKLTELRDCIAKFARLGFHEMRPIDAGTNPAAVQDLGKACGLFELIRLDCECKATKFLRVCALQSFVTSTLVSTIEQSLFALGHSSDSDVGLDQNLLERLNRANVGYENGLSWKLITAKKLDKLQLQHDCRYAMQPSKEAIYRYISGVLAPFYPVEDNELKTSLDHAIDLAIELWRAQRHDDLSMKFDQSSQESKLHDWEIVLYDSSATYDDQSINVNSVEMRDGENAYTLFPCVSVASMAPRNSHELTPLVKGLALQQDSLAIPESKVEAQDLERAIREIRRTVSSHGSSITVPD